MNLGENASGILPENLELEDKWIVGRLNTVAREVTENLERFELGIAVAKIYMILFGMSFATGISSLSSPGSAAIKTRKTYWFMFFQTYSSYCTPLCLLLRKKFFLIFPCPKAASW
jgi:hypothetical protein